MTAQFATVRLKLDSRAESVSLVRSMLAGITETLALDPELSDDLRTAVSEACNNVVLYAYDGDSGPLAVDLKLEADRVQVVIRDWGGGIQDVAPADDHMGVGLALMTALADRAEFSNPADGGTEVCLEFAARRPVTLPDGGPPADGFMAGELDGEVVVTVSPVPMLVGVLGRIARALAAQARFSLDRFSDVYLVTDTIAAHAESAALAGELEFAMSAKPRRLELTIGPFAPGSGGRLPLQSRSGDQDSALELLTDELTVQPRGDAELLHVVLLDHR